jgi:hypothetical protein
MEHPMGRPPIGKIAMTATERSHRFRAKQRVGKPATKSATKPEAADTGPLRARIRELEAELSLERTRSKILKASLRDAQRVENKPKAEKPALPPDEQRDRRIKALTTANLNL